MGLESDKKTNRQKNDKKDEKKTDKLIGTTVGEKYKLSKVLGKGSFGVCYEGIDTTLDKKVAIKLESTESKEARNLIKKEIDVYKKLKGIEGIPHIYMLGKEKNVYLIAMQLLGQDLADLFKMHSKRFSLKTIFMIGEQLILRIRTLHEKNFIHRDLKPENFLIGRKDRSNKVFIIDFGLTKLYIDEKTKKHIPNTSGRGLTGTVRYCALNAHKGIELSRRDDLESAAIILIYFCRGRLPWDGWKTLETDRLYVDVRDKKENLFDTEFCNGMPTVLTQFLKYCRQLGFEETPDYDHCLKMFVQQKDIYKFEWDYKYDWVKS